MKKRIAVLFAAAALMMTGSAYALTTTNNMNVLMQVYTPTNCTISAGGVMDFGTYTTNLNTNYTANTTVNVACTTGRSFNVYPDNGLHYNGGLQMANASNALLNYALFKDAGLNSFWTSSNRVYGTGIGSSQSYTVYGVLPGGQLPADGTQDGTFNDTITMTIEYNP